MTIFLSKPPEKHQGWCILGNASAKALCWRKPRMYEEGQVILKTTLFAFNLIKYEKYLSWVEIERESTMKIWLLFPTLGMLALSQLLQ